MAMMPFRLSRRVMLAAAPLLAIPLGGGTAMAAEGDFNGFLAGLRRDALASGIRPATVDLAFRYIQFLPRVIELDQRQPDHTLTFAEFMNKVGRINKKPSSWKDLFFDNVHSLSGS